MNEESKLKLLKQIYLFSELNDTSLRNILNCCREVEFPKSKLIVSENSPGDSLFVITDGSVKVNVISQDGKEIILTTLQSGEFFGEMSLLDGAPRSANVIALTKTKALILDRDAFLTRVIPNKDIAAAILAVMSRRLREANEKITNLISMDVFDRLAYHFQKEAASKGRELLDGSTVFERLPQGDIASIIGSSRETVTRMIKEMVDLGFIISSGKSIILKKNFNDLVLKRHESKH